jgi:hypothetical protein
MLAVVGTLPEADFPLMNGPVELREPGLVIQGRPIEVTRGTAALLAAACACLHRLGHPPPVGFLVGDTGRGAGSAQLYAHAAAHLGDDAFTAITFHYLLPMVDWHGRVFFALEEIKPRPLLIADAGFMYVAKMSGLATHYDLFTPDAGELAFLADEEAPHPFYTRGFILHEENRVPDLIRRAYAHGNAARYLLVKGRTDYLADRDGVLATVSHPEVETLEPMGGTGDTLTGIASALIAAGLAVREAAILAARVNRLAGALAQPTPATSVTEIIARIPEALGALYPPDAGTGSEPSSGGGQALSEPDGTTPQELISSDMTLLEIIYQHRQTGAVFRQYDAEAGVCLCCQALFDSLVEASHKYGLNLVRLLANLQEAVQKQ